MGYGFLEKVYENAMMYELEKNDLNVKNQYPISVYYENVVVGEYLADILVEDKIILELKIAEAISEIHEKQLYHYLRATKMQLGLLLNFEKTATKKRIIMQNH